MQIETQFRSLAALAACIIVLTLSGSPAHSQSYGDAVKGKAFVDSNCARCHAVGLNDDSHMPEAPAFRTLHNSYPIDSLAEAFAEGIVTGHPAMPQFELSIDTINDMLAYMKSLSGPGD
jgi:mono/diheme cytochrome c family protein